MAWEGGREGGREEEWRIDIAFLRGRRRRRRREEGREGGREGGREDVPQSRLRPSHPCKPDEQSG